MIIKRMAWISAVILISLSLIFYFINMYDSKKKDEIMSELDTRLSAFDLAKSTTLKVQDLISIRTQEDYDAQRQVFKKILSDAMFNDYFPTAKYKGGNKTFSITSATATGEIRGETDFVFKLEMHLSDKGNKIPVTLLVFIKDNIVYKIQSLG